MIVSLKVITFKITKKGIEISWTLTIPFGKSSK